MRIDHSRRSFAAAMMVAMTITLPVTAFAGPAATGNNIKTTVKPSKERDPKDKITTTCVPGTPDYDINKCHEEITRK